MILNAIDRQILGAVADLHDVPPGAYNIRKDGEGIARRSSANIEIIPKKDKPGIDVLIKPGTRNESVHIPVILTRSGFKDLVYNTFEVGEGADVTIVAGCGIHNAGESSSQHDGIHHIYVRRGARLRYVEKHYGQGEGRGQKILNPRTIIEVEEEAAAEMELVQIRGVDSTQRITEANIHRGGYLKVVERLLTHGEQRAESSIVIRLLGEDSNAQVISRSVGQDRSWQLFKALLTGSSRCRGHVECSAIIMDEARIAASPELCAEHADAELTHEAAIGKIAGEQLLKLMSLGLTEKEAIDTILAGFLR